MNRRDLLKILLSAPIAAELDVEKLLWVPKPIMTVPAMSRPYLVSPDGMMFLYLAPGSNWVPPINYIRLCGWEKRTRLGTLHDITLAGDWDRYDIDKGGK